MEFTCLRGNSDRSSTEDWLELALVNFGGHVDGQKAIVVI